jgi:hypothetical protein
LLPNVFYANGQVSEPKHVATQQGILDAFERKHLLLPQVVGPEAEEIEN